MENLIKEIESLSKLEEGEIPKRFMKLQEESGEWSAAYLEQDGFKVPKKVKTPEELNDHVLEEGCDTLIMVFDILFKLGFSLDEIKNKTTQKLGDWGKVIEAKSIKEEDKESVKIIQNALLCKTCGDIVVSQHVHDYQVCSCGCVMVDGGKEYFKCSYRNSESLQLVDSDSFEDIKNKLVWGTFGKNGEFKTVKYVKLVDCETEHLNNILNNGLANKLYVKVIYNILADRKYVR